MAQDADNLPVGVALDAGLGDDCVLDGGDGEGVVGRGASGDGTRDAEPPLSAAGRGLEAGEEAEAAVVLRQGLVLVPIPPRVSTLRTATPQPASGRGRVGFYQFFAMVELPRGLRIFLFLLDVRTGWRPERRFFFCSSRPMVAGGGRGLNGRGKGLRLEVWDGWWTTMDKCPPKFLIGVVIDKDVAGASPDEVPGLGLAGLTGSALIDRSEWLLVRIEFKSHIHFSKAYVSR